MNFFHKKEEKRKKEKEGKKSDDAINTVIKTSGKRGKGSYPSLFSRALEGRKKKEGIVNNLCRKRGREKKNRKVDSP